MKMIRETGQNYHTDERQNVIRVSAKHLVEGGSLVAGNDDLDQAANV
jgi:hypothetical protein